MDPDRAARLRDNKRRFRSRQKEYVADLERSLRELREQGIQATKEVQLAARNVDRENGQLRGLLRHLGVDDDIVDSWIQKDENGATKTTLCTKRPQEGSAQITSSKIGEKKQGNTNRTCVHNLPSPPPAMPTSELKEVESAAQCLASLISTSYLPSKHQRSSPSRECVSETSSTLQPESAGISRTSSMTRPERTCILETYSTRQPGKTCIPEALSATPAAPCKLITHLAANPSADITQIPIAIDSVGQSNEADGVECSRAYQMLMQFATTEDKLDTIAHTLENGCVANKGPGGGCKVPNKVVWKTLDDIQS